MYRVHPFFYTYITCIYLTYHYTSIMMWYLSLSLMCFVSLAYPGKLEFRIGGDGVLEGCGGVCMCVCVCVVCVCPGKIT